MTIESVIADLAAKVDEYRPQLTTEEGTKTAIVLPFIAKVLGYDIFDPAELLPEFTADLGTKKGEKIDYAIYRDGVVQILIECKRLGDVLDTKHASQLFRYFHTSNARVGVLTNGQHWHFFTDLDKPNRMDEKPFLRLDLCAVDPYVIPELAKLTKDSFDLESVLMAAEELKYVSSIKRVIAELFAAPSEDFSRFLISQVHEGSQTAKVREFFNPLVAKALVQFVNDRVNERLKSALGQVTPVPTALSDMSSGHDEQDRDEIETTVDELEGFHVVRAIVASVVPWDRVTARDTKSYFGVMVDDNNRKQICRLHFNRKQKYLGLLDADKVESRVPLASVGEIYQYSEQLREAAQRYL